MKRESFKFLILIASLCTGLLASFGCATDGKQLDGTTDEATVATSQAEQDIGGGDPPGCSGISFCYCSCRVFHPCGTNPAECTPLSQCLTSCDAQHPGCTAGGPLNPKRIQDCFLARAAAPQPRGKRSHLGFRTPARQTARAAVSDGRWCV